MVLLVPYDGSELSKTALQRATEFAAYREEEVVALSVVPDDPEFAHQRGWVSEGESVDVDAICEELTAEIHDVAPEATVRCEQPETSDSFTATLIDDVTRTIRETAADLGASIVFIGSENAGRVSTPVTSVGSPVSEDPRYDVHIVRHTD